jgi:hypothetical protein
MPYEELDDLKYELLWSANEDVTGVWELLATANGWWPHEPASERLRRAESALLWALERELISFYADSRADQAPIPRAEADNLLRDWTTWAIPEGPRVFYWRTEAGQRMFADKPLPASWVRRTWLDPDAMLGKNAGRTVEHPDLD